MKETVLAWKKAALADGWSIEPTYSNESVDRAFRLKRENYVVSCIAREPMPKPEVDDSILGKMVLTLWEKSYNPREKPVYNMHAWSPDGIALNIPVPYSWDALVANRNLCGECNTIKPHVQRVAFCNRVCDDCLTAARAKYERPGWNS